MYETISRAEAKWKRGPWTCWVWGSGRKFEWSVHRRDPHNNHELESGTAKSFFLALRAAQRATDRRHDS